MAKPRNPVPDHKLDDNEGGPSLNLQKGGMMPPVDETGTRDSAKEEETPTGPSPELVALRQMVEAIPKMLEEISNSFEERCKSIDEKFEMIELSMKRDPEASPDEHYVGSTDPIADLMAVNQANEATNGEVVKIIHDTCGPDFTVRVETAQPGISFKLIITPPFSLQETPTDVRVKVIPNSDGLSGVQQYAEKVRDYCIGWAYKHGIPYAKGGGK